MEESEALVNRVTTIDCSHVIQAISDYIDCEVDPDLRERIEAHLSGCLHGHAILDGTRNVITLVGDDTTFEIPAGFGTRLYTRLQDLLR